jgi:diguanylate cyclase (GGDEF)-like protein
MAMFSKGISGIGQRVARLMAIVAFTSVLFAAIMNIGLQVSRDIQTRKANLQSMALALASATADAVVAKDAQKAANALTAVSRIPDLLTATIVLPDRSELAVMGQAVFLDASIVEQNDSDLSLLYKGILPISTDIIKGGEVKARLVIIADITSLRAHVAWTLLGTLCVALLAAAVGAFASRPLQRRITQPLAHLTAAISQLRTARNYATNLQDDNTPDEAGILVKAFNGLMTDIRSRDQALQQLAYHDPMTGLPNRVQFQREVDEWLSRPFEAPTGAIIFVNIHSFRAMNDAFSQTIGDAIILSVAAQIQSALREEVHLARYSGDEFSLLVRSAKSRSDVEMCVARMQTAFHAPVRISDLALHISLSCGATVLEGKDNGVSSDEVLREATLALTEARDKSPGTLVHYREELATRLQLDTALEHTLRQATKDGAFELHYQPQLDLKNGNISGFEALLRWRHPIRGFVSPAVFVPIAERIGIINTIGDWVMLEGCRQAAVWHAKGRQNRMMSINVSLAQILSAGFVERVRAVLERTQLPPQLLCLELTESMFVGAHYAETTIVLETLAKDGVKLALDDFGTGYSSLGYLTKLPFHFIKIDRSFISGADKNERKRGMLKSIVDMIQALGMTVVAEGAETEGEFTTLQAVNANKVQGYFVSRPAPAEQAEANARAIDQGHLKLSA